MPQLAKEAEFVPEFLQILEHFHTQCKRYNELTNRAAQIKTRLSGSSGEAILGTSEKKSNSEGLCGEFKEVVAILTYTNNSMEVSLDAIQGFI